MTATKIAAAAVTVLNLSAFAPATGQTLRIYHIDVDQADATLLVSPEHRSGPSGHEWFRHYPSGPIPWRA